MRELCAKRGARGLKAKSVVNLVESLHNSRDLTSDRQDSDHYRMDNTNCLVNLEVSLILKQYCISKLL